MSPPRFPASRGALPPEGALAALGRPGGGSVRLILPILCALALLLLFASCAPARAQVPPAAAPYRTTLLREAQAQWGLGAPVAALAAQVHQESGWRADAVSSVGARGMAQFMPATARWWCDFTGVAKADCLPHNPTWALRALVGYDVWLFKRTPARLGDYDRLWLALRGYNGGEGHWQAEAKTTGLAAPTREQIDAACGRAKRAALHCRENLGYPQRILAVLQPRYAEWGALWLPAAVAAATLAPVAAPEPAPAPASDAASAPAPARGFFRWLFSLFDWLFK